MTARILVKAAAMAVLAMGWLAGMKSAKADILFIDTNDQAIEREAILDLGRRYGETVHIVKADGPELEEIFAKAERGELELTTVVGSGHSGGTSFAGKNGSAYSLGKLVEKYPAAQSQVRHFIGLGCYTGTKYNALEWQTRFPNATLIAGFNGLAPSGHWSARFLRQVYSTIGNARRNAGGDENLAERLGSQAEQDALKRILRGLDSVKITVASFQVCEQFYDPKPKNREKLADEVRAGRSIFNGYFRAWQHDDPPANPHAPSALRTFYNDVQEYLGVAPEEEREELLKIKEQTIRLIYFGNVKKAWARHHADEITAANRALAAANLQTLPTEQEIAGMTRRQIVDLSRSLGYAEASLGEGEDADAARRMIESAKNELVELDVPFNWID